MMGVLQCTVAEAWQECFAAAAPEDQYDGHFAAAAAVNVHMNASLQ
jgi:hypothetical protein